MINYTNFQLIIHELSSNQALYNKSRAIKGNHYVIRFFNSSLTKNNQWFRMLDTYKFASIHNQ